jgi:gliding motility-associated-like protein
MNMKKLLIFSLNIFLIVNVLFAQQNTDKKTISNLKNQRTINALSIAKENIDGIKLRWKPVHNAVAYEVSLNDAHWILTTGTELIDFQNNVHSKIQIRSVFSDGTKSQIVMARLVGGCDFKVEITGMTQPTCYGDTDGSITVKYEGTNQSGMTPVFTYQLDSGPVYNNASGLNGTISGGNHLLIAKDISIPNGCSDTLMFFMPQPDSIKLDIAIDTARCSNNNLGKFTALPSGGTGAFSYYWNTFPGTTTATLNNVFGNVTRNILVTDSKQCKKNKTVTMPLIAGLTATPKVDSIKCYGANNAKITVNIGTAASPVTYKWNKNSSTFGGNTSSISNLVPAVYTVTVTDANACSYTKSFTITEPFPLKIDAVVKKASCTAADGEITVTAKGGTPKYTYLWNYQNANTQTINGLASGTFVVTVTDKNGCKLDSTYVLAPSNNIDATVQVNNTKCSNTNDGEITVAIVGGGTATYLWSDPNKQKTATAKNLAAGKYTVTITDPSGCTLIKDGEVKNALAIDLVLTPTTAKCFNSTTEKITANATGGNGGFIYTWNTSVTNAVLDNISPGTYTVTVTDSKGCTVEEKATIISPSAIKFSNQKTVDVKCFGNSNGEASINATGGTGTFSYKWNDPNAQISSKAINLAAGIFEVSATDANGCVLSKSIEIKTPAQIQNTLTVKLPKCNNGVDGEISTSATGGVTPYTYAWENLLAKTSAIQNINAGFYTISITDKNKCQIVDTVTLINPPKLNLTLSQVEKSCAGLSNSATVVEVKGGTAPFTYLWNDKNKTTDKLLSKIAKGTYTVEVTDGNKCKTSGQISVTEHDSIIANLVFVKPTCFEKIDGQIGISILKGGSGNGDLSKYNYAWNTSPPQSTPQIINLKGGKTYQVSISDNVGCKGIASALLPQPVAISITPTINQVKCFDGKDGEITVLAKGENPNFTYTWSHDFTNTTNVATNLISGDYIINVKDDKACEASLNIIMTEPEALTLASKTVKNNPCFGEEKGEIKVSANGGVGGYQYLWSNGLKVDKISNLKAGNYTISVSDKNKCLVSEEIKVKQPDELGFEVDTKMVTCFGGKDGKITFLPKGGTQPFLFSRDGATYNGKQQLVGLVAGTYTLYIKDRNGCISTEDLAVDEPDKFTIVPTSDTSLYYGKSVVLTATPNNNQGKVTVDWTAISKEALSCNRCDSTVLTAKTSMSVFVKATDTKGCIATGTTNIEIIRSKDVFVPSGFSPNFDNNNDKLVIHGREGTKVLWFRVYDRWGEQVFENTNFEINCMMCGWDGSYRGSAMPSGVYVWTAEVESINGEHNILKGNVTVIR